MSWKSTPPPAPRYPRPMSPAPAPNPHLIVAKVERQHALIEQLGASSPKPLSGAAIAERLGVSVRTVERDIRELVAAGVPISPRRGDGGGYLMAIPSRSITLSVTPGKIGALLVSLVRLGPPGSATALSLFEKVLVAIGSDEETDRGLSA